MTVHLFQPDSTVAPDHRGQRPCLHCPLPRSNKVHDVPAVPDEVKQIELRKVGEA